MQDAACKSSRKVIDENVKLHQELQTRRKQIDMRCKQLEDLAIKGNIDREMLAAAKEKVVFLYV